MLSPLLLCVLNYSSVNSLSLSLPPMDEDLKEFYKSLDRNAFKYFVKEGAFYVYEDDLRFTKGSKSKVEEHVLENAIREALSLHKVRVEEYENGVLTKEGYPGNWKDFTDIMLDKKMPPSICSVRVEGGVCSLAFLNTLDNSVYTSSFEDDDVLSNFCGILSEINAFELVYSDSLLEPVVLSLGILSHRVPKASALEGLISFLKIDTPPVKEYIRPNICRVDRRTLEGINMLREGERSVIDSFSCFTIQGHRLLLQFIKHPLKSKEEIKYRQSIVDSLRGIDLSLLKSFPDLLKITKRIQNYKITLQEIVRLHQVFNKIPPLLGRVNTKSLERDFFTPLLGLSGSLKEIQEKVEETVDLEACDRNIFRMKIEGGELRGCYGDVQEKIQEEFNRILKISEKVKYDEGNNVFRITRSEYRQVEDTLKKNNVLVLAVLKTGVQFTTKTLSELNMERERVLERIRREERKALEGLKEFIKERCSEIEVLNYVIALLDVFSAFSLKANCPGYSKPIFKGDKGDKWDNGKDKDNSKDNGKDKDMSEIVVRDMFHPLLENSQYIPNDLLLERERMLIVTGPNMGGKSTFLKSVAVVSLLGQMGCYVPCSYASLPIFDGIYVRMGASDCTYTGDSTFMLEMKDISRIVRESTSSSLVLIDELGRGTSEVDGLSIALAVKDHLLKLNCVTLFATHFPELCREKKGIQTKRVLSDGVLLLYKIGEGVCDESFGINVAKRVGFPQDVIDEALREMSRK